MTAMIGGDEGIMMTNDDCTNCKRCAIKLGYWQDHFIDLFLRGSPRFERKAPEINRGYFARVFAINTIIDRFLEFVGKTSQQCQIVNLGCGFDTLFWRLNEEKSVFKLIKTFVDIDLPGVTSRKLIHIRHRPKLLSALGDDIKFNSLELRSNVYQLVPGDLRKPEDLSAKLVTECKLDKNLPTLFLSECVLIYMTVQDSNNLISWASTHFTNCMFTNYEQINIFDKFGQIMVDNLKQRNCELLDLESCQDLESQKNRFQSNGFDSVKAWDMYYVYRSGIPRNELERIERIEFLDEQNLLEQLLTHYCLLVAKKGLSLLEIDF